MDKHYLEILKNLVEQIENLQGESSVIDEDIMGGDPYVAAVEFIKKHEGVAS